MEEKNKLLKRLQICDFTLNEMVLFLDTHPTNTSALEFYKKHLNMQRETKAKYIEKYGPISPTDYSDQKTWDWIDNPWPWENDLREARK